MVGSKFEQPIMTSSAPIIPITAIIFLIMVALYSISMRLAGPSVFLIRCGTHLGDSSPRITIVGRTAETVLDLLQARPGSRVEWYIAILNLDGVVARSV
jgi:hypothetical protein